MASTPAPRSPSAIDTVADAHVATMSELDPMLATEMGVAGFDHLMTDLSPAGFESRAEAGRAVLRRLDALEPRDDVDAVTLAAMRERIGLELELFESGEVLSELNNIASPVQYLRDIFDVMPTASVEDWSNIASRLALLPEAAAGFTESLRTAADAGHVAAVRQVQLCVEQARELADPSSSFFTSFVSGDAANAALDGQPGTAALRSDLERGARAAVAAHGELADYLAVELAPPAPREEAAGRER